jgi:exodeoxyribonuclease-3
MPSCSRARLPCGFGIPPALLNKGARSSPRPGAVLFAPRAGRVPISAMRLITWNINSVRLRVGLVERLIAEEAPDILCLQETKTPDDKFPREEFAALGYAHMLVHGMKGYNGVAILSRLPLAAPATRSWCERSDCRHAIVELPGGAELHNIYVPAGGDVPDPEANPKFAHKLRFLDELTAWFAAERDAGRAMIAVGDLNIAPLETDVWSHKQLLSVVSHTPVEVARLAALQAAGGFVDAIRHFVAPEERLYTWWSYRNRDWAASDRGRRLDHIWVTPPLVGALAAGRVHKHIRGWQQSSDHVPVMIEFG